MAAEAKGFGETAEKEMVTTSKNSVCLGLWPGGKAKEAILNLGKKPYPVNVMKRTWRKAITPLQAGVCSACRDLMHCTKIGKSDALEQYKDPKCHVSYGRSTFW